MSFNNNNKSGSASASAKGFVSAPISAKGSQKGSCANSPSQFSNNPFAPLFKPESQVYNKTSPGPSSLFKNKIFVHKASSSHLSGADSSGPMGQFTTKRAEFVAARTASFVPNTPPPKVARKVSPPAVRPKRPFHSTSWLEAEARSCLLKANIDEMYKQRELTNEAINQMTNLRREILVEAGIFPLATHAQDKWLDTMSKKSMGKRPMTAGETFLASKEESALEEFAKKANKAELVAAGLATGWSDEELKAGGWTSSEEFAMRANVDSYTTRAKQGV